MKRYILKSSHRVGADGLDLYNQQKKMFDEKKHRVEDRIVSIQQPYIRPIVRGKTKAPVEFGTKYDVSIDEKGHARLEKLSFDPYNECNVLPDALEKYKERTGHYPKRVLVDQIYRTKANRSFCEERGIKMSGRKPGRPPKNDTAERKFEKLNDRDRNEVERFFSWEKESCGAALIVTRLSNTTLASIALSVFCRESVRSASRQDFFCRLFCGCLRDAWNQPFLRFFGRCIVIDMEIENAHKKASQWPQNEPAYPF